jgi:hypothetical protein
MKSMTRHIKRLSPLVTPAVAVLWAVTTLSPLAASPLAADRPAAADQAGSRVLLADRKILIRGGCPYNLDKVCYRAPNGRLYNCRCQS